VRQRPQPRGNLKALADWFAATRRKVRLEIRHSLSLASAGPATYDWGCPARLGR